MQKEISKSKLETIPNKFSRTFFVLVNRMEDFKNNREFLKYCFLMQDYRHTQKKCFPEVFVDNSVFSIKNNVELMSSCRLIENQSYLDIYSSDFIPTNSQVISSVEKYKGLLEQITS